MPLLTALAPIFFVIGLGVLLRRSAIVEPGFWPAAERLTYFLFFPALIVEKLSAARFDDPWVLPLMATLLAAILSAVTLIFLLQALLRLPGDPFSSVFQGAIRPNTYVGLAAAAALFGNEGLVVTAVAFALTVPLVNVLSVVVLLLYGNHGTAAGRARLGMVVRSVLANPIILAVAVGALMAATDVRRPPVLIEIIEILARAALPVGLIAVGAALDLAAARSAGLPLAAASLVKLILLPLAAIWLGTALGLTGPAATIAVILCALPCAPSAYVLTRQLGGDARLMAGLITTQTLAATVTMPAVLALT